MLVLLQRFRHRYLLSHLSSFGAVNPSEKVNEVVLSLCLSCSGHAWVRMLLHMILGLFLIQRMQSPLSGYVFAFYLSFPFCFSLGRSSYCRFVLVSVSRFHMRILDFLLEMSLGHQLQSCNNHTSCRQLSSLERRLATSISILPTSELVSGTDSPICCQYVCQWLLTTLHPTLCRSPERCRSLIWLLR